MAIAPPPRSVTERGGPGDPTEIGAEPDPSLPPQGYRLRIGRDGTLVDHADDAGLRYARQTLRSIAAAGDVVAATVTDHPALPTRGYMLDISRDRVPTRATLARLVDLLGAVRINELMLYTEHTFAWADHEEVWRDASPMTRADLDWLRSRCSATGIDLVPCGNAFGHMERFLCHDTYRHRAECPDGAPPIGGGDTVRPPSTLAPTPDNAEFAVALFREYVDALPSDRIHIGGDEPFELGHGVSADEVRERGRSAVYLDHLRRIVEPLVADGLEVLFWGDVLRDRPELVSSLPDGLTAVVWHYEPPDPDAPPLSSLLGPELLEVLGMPDDGLVGFSAHTRTFHETGVPFRVAPGASTWNSLLGRWPSARANIDDAVTTGIAQGALGSLLTDWGDNGHHQPPAVSLPAIVHHGHVAWTGTPPAERTVVRAIDLHTGISGLGDRLVELGRVHERLGVRSFNASPLWEAVVGRAHHARGLAPPATVDDILALLDDAAAEPDTDLTAGLGAAARLARVGVWRLCALADRAVVPQSTVDDELVAAAEAQHDAWLRTSRPGGLDDSLVRLR